MKLATGARTRRVCGVRRPRAGAAHTAPGGIAVRFASWLARRATVASSARRRRGITVAHPRARAARAIVVCNATPALAARGDLSVRVALLLHAIASAEVDRIREPRTVCSAVELPSQRLRDASRWASPARLRVRDGRGTEQRRASSGRVRGARIFASARAAVPELATLRVPGVPEAQPRSARPHPVAVVPRTSVARGAGRAVAHAEPRVDAVELAAPRAVSVAHVPNGRVDVGAAARTSPAREHVVSDTRVVLERHRAITDVETVVRRRVAHVPAIKGSSAQVKAEHSALVDHAAPRAERRASTSHVSEPVALRHAQRAASSPEHTASAHGRDLAREFEELRSSIARRAEPAPLAAPQLDVAALGRQIRGEMERHARIERERRGR